MSLRKIDKSLPYGEIYGDSSGACFEQHGIRFDSAGTELPGFEDVVVPDKQTIVVVGDDSALKAELARLAAVVGSLQTQLDDKDAAYEEVLGKLDTANVELGQLRALNVDGGAGQPEVPAAGADVDAQLDLQTGGAAGKKGK